MAVEKDWKRGLQEWAERKGVTPATFAKKTGYSYQHAFNLLRGNTPVTEDTLGRILVGYGCEAAGEVMALSGQAPCSE